jgi:hypothetical protein
MIVLLAACSGPEPLVEAERDLVRPTTTEAPDVAPLDVDCPAGVVLVGDVAYDGLEAALAAVEPGDVVAIGSGRYVGPFEVPVPITIGGVGAVVLDGEGRGPALTVAPGTRVLDLTVTGGRGELGGGVTMSGPGELVLARTTVVGNTADGGGGVWIAPGSTAWLVDATITENSARAGGGVSVEGSTLHARASRVTFNDAEDGGGLACRDGAVTLDDTRLAENAAVNGGGLYADGCSIEGGELVANVADFYGGGAALLESVAAGLAVADNEGAWGGGLYALASDVASATIERNVADEGAGVFAVAGLTLEDTRILDHAGVGLALGVDRADVLGGAILGNEIGAESSGGLGQVLTSVGTDWGSGSDDNAYDVAWGFGAFAFPGRATFTCEGGACER